MSLRTEFVLFASQDGANIRPLPSLRHFPPPATSGFSAGFRKAPPVLQDRPRIPHHSPNRSSDDITALLRMAHARHERWGARKIKRWLEDRGHTMPAFSTVHNLMARHGLLPGTAPGIPATGRFEHDAPNRLWQMDFKGPLSLWRWPLPSAHPAG